MNNSNHQTFLDEYKNVWQKEFECYASGFSIMRNDYENLLLDSFKDYSTNFVRLVLPYQKLLAKEVEENRQHAWDFSVFNIVKILRVEENLHSPFLKTLLDPLGSHGQQDLFYRLFVEELLGIDNAKKFINEDNYKAYHIKSEEFIRNHDNKGRIDLTIKSANPKKRFAIILENKWESGDSCPDQLYKYYRNFTDGNIHGYTDVNLLVVYLSKHGQDPSWVEDPRFKTFLEQNKGVNYFPISYRKEIKSWLEKCEEFCFAVNVKYLISQYLKVINEKNRK